MVKNVGLFEDMKVRMLNGTHSPLAPLAYLGYLGRVDEQGNPIEVKDPMAAKLRALSDAEASPAAKVANLLSVDEVISSNLAAQLQFGLGNRGDAINSSSQNPPEPPI